LKSKQQEEVEMEYRQIGKTGMNVSTISMGGWGIVGDAHWGSRDEKESISAIHAALDAGINFFDTAELYANGESEVLLGKALGKRRQEVVVSTKVSDYNLASENVLKSCEASLRRLNTDYIDLYEIHYANHNIPIDETAEALMQLKEQGKVRALGVCNFGVQDMSDLLAITRFEINQVPYSLIWRAIEFEISQACAQQGIGLVAYSPLVHGLLGGGYVSADEFPAGRARTRHFSKERPRTRHGEPGCEEETFATIDAIRHICSHVGRPMPEIAIAWLLHRPNVASVTMGARNADQVRRNLQATTLKLTPEIIQQLDEATDDLKQKLGPNPDLWQSDSRFR
jgi:myo-inositol catabolism protein IolS